MTTGTTSANHLVCKLSWSFCNIKRYQYILTIRIGAIRINHVLIRFLELFIFRDIEYITNLQERNEFDAILLIFVMNVEFPMSYFV